MFSRLQALARSRPRRHAPAPGLQTARHTAPSLGRGPSWNESGKCREPRNGEPASPLELGLADRVILQALRSQMQHPRPGGGTGPPRGERLGENGVLGLRVDERVDQLRVCVGFVRSEQGRRRIREIPAAARASSAQMSAQGLTVGYQEAHDAKSLGSNHQLDDPLGNRESIRPEFHAQSRRSAHGRSGAKPVT
jgi:hypothetical protein